MSRLHLAGALLLAALASPTLAAGEPGKASAGSFELSVGNYRPGIDGQSGLTGTPLPYARDFGTGRPTSFGLHLAKALPWHAAGSLELGVGVGYWQAKGHGTLIASDTDPTVPAGQSSDPTSFSVVPTEATATWRLDFVWERLGLPLVPYARASLQRYNWWITGSSGSTTKTGATNGYGYGGGLALVLDFLDPILARELEADSGIKHTMLTVDWQKTKVNDFGSGTSWDMTDTGSGLRFGLLFVF